MCVSLITSEIEYHYLIVSKDLLTIQIKKNPLYMVCVINIFSHFVTCLLIFTGHFMAQKVI